MKIFILTVLLAISLNASADMDLKPIHPDEPVEYTFNKRFSTNNALDSLNRMRMALQSFRELTEKSKGKISKKLLTQIGHTGWETQNLGFRNWPKGIEGTLYT